jgi:hypothetical protein
MNKSHVATTILVLAAFTIGFAEPNGAVLYRLGKRQGRHKVAPTAEHHYFGYLEGPAWENKYSAFRVYVDKDDRNALDIIGKFKEEAILQHFVDATVDEHTSWPWGTDILSVGSSMGLGAFRLYNNGSWLNPQIPENLDSLVVTIVDSSVQTPMVTIGYYGWNFGGGPKINALWTISTSLNERSTHCELAITGDYSGKVVIGLVNHKENTNNPNRNTIALIQDQDPPLLATLGKQGGLSEGFADTLLMAVAADKSYFDSFVKQGATNLGMVLTPDANKKVKWSFAYSWAREASPLFRNPDWKKVLTGTTPTLPYIRQAPAAFTAPAVESTSPTDIFTLSGKLLGSGTGSRDRLLQKTTPGIYLTGKGKARPHGRQIFPITGD